MSHHGLFFALCLGVGMALGGAELALDSIRIRVGDLEGLPYLEPSMYSRLETTTSGTPVPIWGAQRRRRKLILFLWENVLFSS